MLLLRLHVLERGGGVQVDAQGAEAFEPPGDGPAEVRLAGVDRHPEAVGPGPCHGGGSLDQQSGAQLVGAREIASGISTFRPPRQQGISQPALAAGPFARQRGRPGLEIGQGRAVGGGRPRPLSGQKIEAGQLDMFAIAGDPAASAVELLDDVEDALGQGRAGRVRQQGPADLKVDAGPLVGGDELIGRLPYAVVWELVSMAVALEQPRSHRRRELGIGLLLRDAQQLAQGEAVGAGSSQAGQVFQREPCLVGEAPQLGRHQLADVVGEPFGPDGGQVPVPDPGLVIELDQTLVAKHAQELDDEERVPPGLLLDEILERLDLAAVAVEDITQETVEVLSGQGFEQDGRDRRTGALQVAERGAERVAGAHLVGTVSAHHEQVGRLRVGDEIPEQGETGGVGPLQVVEEQRQRLPVPGQGGHEPSKDQPESVLGLAPGAAPARAAAVRSAVPAEARRR